MNSEVWIKIAPIMSASLIAVVGWFITYFHRLAFDRRSAKLERINKQLRELYGPLYASLKASSETYVAFQRKYWPAHGESGYFAGGNLN
ncbi:MAG: hypothetical protein Q7U64_14410 [Desulfocapsaceae bacterium]|nr:hypothetical protein [Desulfocapsaceae bacterium]